MNRRSFAPGTLRLQTRNRSGVGLNVRDANGANMDQLAAELKTRMTKLDDLIGRYEKQLKDGLTPDQKAELEKSATEVKELAGRMGNLEQQLIAGAQTRQQAETVGAILTRNKDFTDQAATLLHQRQSGSVTVRLNTRNTLTLSALGGDVKLIPTDQILPAVQRPLSVLDMIPWIDTTLPLVSLLRESASSLLADIVPESELKPESNLVLGMSDIKIVTIAHWMRVSNQVLADMPMLEAYLQGRMAYGVRLRLEHLVINGTTDVKGLMATENHIIADAEPSPIDTINKSKYKAWASYLPPEAVILHPEDWSEIERTKGTDGHYIFGIPTMAAQPSLWSVPVVISPAMPQGKHWVGNLSQATQGYLRQDVDVVLSTEDRDNFIRNLVTIRAEGLFGFGVVMPDACVAGALTGAAGPSIDP